MGIILFFNIKTIMKLKVAVLAALGVMRVLAEDP